MKPNGPLRIIHQKPIISINHYDLCAIQHIVKVAPKEAQWFHRVTKVENPENTRLQIFNFYEMYIPEQYCSGAEVESDPQMMVTFYKELKEKHGNEKTNDIFKNMSVWCHSHHTMGVNPSGQDRKQFEEQCEQALSQDITTPQAMMIFNKKNEYYCRIYDPETGFEFENVDIIVNGYDFNWINEEAKTKFKKPVNKVVTSSTKSYRRGGVIDWQGEMWSRTPSGKAKIPEARSHSLGGVNDWHQQKKKQQERKQQNTEKETELQAASQVELELGITLDTSLISCYPDIEAELNSIDETNNTNIIQSATKEIITAANNLLGEDLVVLNTLINGSEDDIWELENSIPDGVIASGSDVLQAEVELFELISDGVVSLETIIGALQISLDLKETRTAEEVEVVLDKWLLYYQSDLDSGLDFEIPANF